MAPEETKGLLEERETLLQRISRIEELKHTAKPEIYEKVKRDYESQLEGINQKLRTSKEYLRMELNDYQEERKILLDQKKVLEDDLEEASFRQSIGEFPRDVFEKVKSKNETELKNFGVRLQELDGKIKSLQEMMEEKVARAPFVEKLPEEPFKEGGLGIEIPEELGAKIDSIIGSELGVGAGVPEEKAKEEVKEGGEFEKISLDEILWDEGKLEGKEESTSMEEAVETEGEGLVCPKCQTVNQADNWYCEKCGTELLVGGSSLS